MQWQTKSSENAIQSRFFNLDVKTLFSVSNALIGSVIDFSAFSISQLSRSFEKKLQLIQNSTIRSILYLPYYTSQEILDSMAGLYGITSVDSRVFDLNQRYFERNINFNNPLIIKLIKEYKIGFEAREINIKTLLCPHNDLFNFNAISR